MCSFRPDQPFFKVTNKTTLLFFNIVSLYFNTLFDWYINLTIDGTVYPSQHFPFGAACVCQAGNFWTLLRNNREFNSLNTEFCQSYIDKSSVCTSQRTPSISVITITYWQSTGNSSRCVSRIRKHMQAPCGKTRTLCHCRWYMQYARGFKMLVLLST